MAVADQGAMERFARAWNGKAEVLLTTDQLLWIEDFGHLWTRVEDVLSLVSRAKRGRMASPPLRYHTPVREGLDAGRLSR